MEDVSQEKIERFLSVTRDSGSGSGWGDGEGSGSGWGAGIGFVNGRRLYSIDGVPTLIHSVHGDAAKGAIFNRDFSLTPCYIAKHNGFFGHGEDLRSALAAAVEKYEENMPEEDRIRAFVEAHEKGQAYSNQDFFDWHHKLTGSCEMGRRQFARDHDIDLSGSMTPMEFIELTESSYGGSTIRKLRPYYE